MNGGLGGQRAHDGQGQYSQPSTPEMSLDEIEAARNREITSKAMTGILLLLLKWLRVSRKFSAPTRRRKLLVKLTGGPRCAQV